MDVDDDDLDELPVNTVIYSLHDDGTLEIDGHIEVPMIPLYLSQMEIAMSALADRYNAEKTNRTVH